MHNIIKLIIEITIIVSVIIISIILFNRFILEILKQLISWTFEEIKNLARSDQEKNISRMAGDATTDAPLPKDDKKKSIKSLLKKKIKKHLDLD